MTTKPTKLEMNLELSKLIEEKDLVESMKKSVMESEKNLQVNFEAFLSKHFDLGKGSTFNMMDLIKKVSEL